MRSLEEQCLAWGQLLSVGGRVVGWKEKHLSTSFSLSPPTAASVIYASPSQARVVFAASLKGNSICA